MLSSNLVQTFCSFGKNPLRNKFGWYSSRYHLLSWALSCCSIREFHHNLTLFTDQHGYDLLIDKLELPYNKAIISFDDMQNKPSSFWGFAKIKTLSLQTAPFVHLDGDVFLRASLPRNLFSAPIVAQNLELSTIRYETNLNWAKQYLSYVPTILRKNVHAGEICACNAGLIGGTDTAFINTFCNIAFRTIYRNNIEKLDWRVLMNLNVLIEQVLFYRLAIKEKKSIDCLFEDPISDFGYTFKQFADFSQNKNETPYLHLIGGHKRSKKTCELMEHELRTRFPKVYKRAQAILPTR